LIKPDELSGSEIQKALKKTSVTKFELLGDRLVAGHIRIVQVIEQTAALADHHQQPATGAVVLDVLLQMLRQRIDPFGQESDLHISRPGVAFVQSEPFNGLSFFHNSVQSIFISAEQYEETAWL
jgi:hypothetical protein